MNVRGVFNKKLLAVSGGMVVVALAAGGIAYASSASGSARPVRTATAVASVAQAGKAGTVSTPARAAVAGRPRLGLRFLVRHTVHADLIVRTRDGYRTIEIDRGRLVSDAGGTITIVRPDGPTVKATLTPTTRYPLLTLSALKPGDRILLVQSNGDALAVRARGSRGGV